MHSPLLCSAGLGAVLLLALAPAARADGVLPASATPVQREQAQARFIRGKDLMSKKHYEDALVELRASREIVASPNTRLEIARCLLAMGNAIAAYAEFGRAGVEAKELLPEDNRYRRTFTAARTERGEMEPQLGFVALTIDNPVEATKVTVGGEEIRRAAWSEPAPVLAGQTLIVVETPGHKPVQRTVTLAAGDRIALTIDAQSGDPDLAEAPPPPPPPPAPPPPKPEPPWLRPGAYVAGGVGVAGIAAFSVLGLLAKSAFDDLNGACPDGRCPPDKAGEISSGKSLETAANVVLVFGIAGVAAGATLFVLSTRYPHGAASAAITVSPGYVGIRGSL